MKIKIAQIYDLTKFTPVCKNFVKGRRILYTGHLLFYGKEEENEKSPKSQYLPWTFLELRKCPGFFNVLKKSSLNVSVERSKGILREPPAGIFREYSQRTFLEHFMGSFRE